ncbi:MAG: dihydrofolate reductase [Planctomycetes bacterium]|nr:dihydrofolate reductase [Planctomycetota bacterium]
MDLLPTPPPALAAPSFALVVAMDEERGIGKDGDLVWRLPEDLKWFRSVTVGNGRQSVIMGRVTWESIPERFRPLPNRSNWVLSRNPSLKLPEGVHSAASLDKALASCSGPRFVIGGGTLYAKALQHPDCRRIYLTEVAGSFGCDTFLAPFGPEWQRTADLGGGEYEDIGYRFVQLDR